MSDSNSNSAPETTSNTAYDDSRVGVDGANNRVLQNGATDLGGGIFGGSAPIAASTFQDTGDIFNPAFNFSNGGGVDDRAFAYDLYQNPAYNPGFSGQPEFSQPSGGAAPRAGDFGGAAQTGGVVTGGNVTAPVASGSDSIAQQVTGGAAVAGDNFGQIIAAPVGGPVIGGDVIDSAVVSAPVSGVVTGGDVTAPVIQTGGGAPITAAGGDISGAVVDAGAGAGGISAPIAAGGDVDISGAAVQGNTGTVNISDASEAIVAAALASNLSASNSALSLAKDSLNAGLMAAKDPSEIVSSNAFKSVALVAGVVGLFAYFANKKAA